MPIQLRRAPVLALGILALLAAMWAGLNRMGWGLPSLTPTLTGAHGPLMVAGFLGTLISLERAVALGQRWMFLAPILSALGALALSLGAPLVAAQVLIALGSLGMLAIFGVILRRQLAPFTITLALGALLWLVGNLLWLSEFPIWHVVLWWAGFLVLTIAGERLELARLMKVSKASQTFFYGVVAILVAGLLVSIFDADAGARATGAGMIGLALWLLRHDIARRNVRTKGLSQFMALGLLIGYGWLALGGVFALIYGGVAAGFQYDALLHSVFLGFVFSMIFAHAPIILPAVLGRAMQFDRAFYAHLALLHLSLILRVGGDLTLNLTARQWGGMLNVIALLVFLANTARSLFWAKRLSQNK